jgi:hypothetical protein
MRPILPQPVALQVAPSVLRQMVTGLPVRAASLRASARSDINALASDVMLLVTISFWKLGTANAERTPRITRDIINSIKVKPRGAFMLCFRLLEPQMFDMDACCKRSKHGLAELIEWLDYPARR